MSPISSRTLYWINTLSKFVSVQLVVQLLGLSSGIFLVRILDQKQYAYYTIATTMQGTMSVLADMGISFGLSSIGGKVWHDRYRFGQLINTALQLRYYLAVISIIIVTPISIWMLFRNGASLFYATLITITVLVGFNFQLTIGVFNVVPRLHSQISQIQQLDLVFSSSRIILLGIAYITVINAAVATSIGAVALATQRLLLGGIVNENIDRKASLNEEDKTEIIKIIQQSAPNTIFYCLQGQITVWLLSIFGSVQSVAEIGALGRLSLIFSMISSVMTSIVLPSFARCQSPDLLLRRYWQILGVASSFAIFLVAFTLLFPDKILWILGTKYSHLQPELIWVMVSAVCYFIANTMWSMNAAKAWISDIWLFIPATIAMQTIAIIFLDFSTLKDVIIFGMIPLIPSFVIHSYMTYKGLSSYKSI